MNVILKSDICWIPFQAYSRTLINIAYGLNHSKELRGKLISQERNIFVRLAFDSQLFYSTSDIFVDLVEKFIEPCKHLHWPLADLKYFLQIYTDSALNLDIMKTYVDFCKTVRRRLVVIRQ